MPKFKPKTGTTTPWTEDWTPTQVTASLDGGGDIVALNFRLVRVRTYEDGFIDREWREFAYPKPTEPGKPLTRFNQIKKSLDDILEELIPA